MSNQEELIKLVKQQIGVEREYAKHLAEVKDKVGIAAARLLLLEMYLNSEKHATILTEMLGILKKVPSDTSLWEYELEEYTDEALVKKEFERHLEKESDTLKCLKTELKQRKDKDLELLLQSIEEDEKRNGRVLQAIMEEVFA